MDWTIEGVEKSDTLVISAFTQANLPISTARLDMRAYQSYAIDVSINETSNSSFNVVVVEIDWYTQAVGGSLITREHFGLMPSNPVIGAFRTYGGELCIQDQCKGAFMLVTITRIAGASTLSGSYAIIASTRSQNYLYARELGLNTADHQGSDDNWIVYPQGNMTINAGAVLTIPGLMRHSQCRYRLVAAQAYTLVVVSAEQPTSTAFALESRVGIAGDIATGNLFMPRMPTLWRITNTSAVNDNFSLSVISEEVRL